VLDWLIARTPINRPIVPRDLVRRSIARTGACPERFSVQRF